MSYSAADATIISRALQLLGTRTTVSAAEMNALSTNEAIQADLIFAILIDWCLTATDWNFARSVSKLTVAKTASGTTWSSSMPAPPWKYEYTLPADYLRGIHLTNNDSSAAGAYYGEPKRFQLSYDTTAEFLLTNEAVAILIYIARIADSTKWPPYFERFLVHALAKYLCMPLTGDKELLKFLEAAMRNVYDLAYTINFQESRRFDSVSPEWIAALGIPYPFNRENILTQGMPPVQPKQQQEPQNGN